MNKSEIKLHSELRSMGCCVCRFINGVEMDFDNVESVTAIHHIDGRTKPNAHSLVIPLCAKHHQYGTAQQPSIHANGTAGGKAQFKQAYGTDEYELLELCEQWLDRPYSNG